MKKRLASGLGSSPLSNAEIVIETCTDALLLLVAVPTIRQQHKSGFWAVGCVVRLLTVIALRDGPTGRSRHDAKSTADRHRMVTNAGVKYLPTIGNVGG